MIPRDKYLIQLIAGMNENDPAIIPTLMAFHPPKGTHICVISRIVLHVT